jgi:hypothetical protein
MIRIIFLIVSIYFFVNISVAQSIRLIDDSLLLAILKQEDPQLDVVISNPDKYEFQLIYTRVIRDSGKPVRFDERSFHLDKAYFYPASLIKFPLSIIALEKLNRLADKNIGLETKFKLNTCSCDPATNSYVRKSKIPNFQQFIRELMIMSNNDAYNLLVDFVGKDEFNSRMKKLGYDGIILKRRFVSGCSESLNRLHGGFEFYSDEDSVLLNLPCDSSYEVSEIPSKYITSAGQYKIENKKRIPGNKDFSYTNFVRLADAHHLLIRLFYPTAFKTDSFLFSQDARMTLIKAMGDFPRELLNAQTDYQKIPDYYYKFFLEPKNMLSNQGNIRIYNKVGLASGFVSDISYFTDKSNNIEFFVSAAMFARKEGIINGGNNQYVDFGFPVLRKIGTLLYQYEIALKCLE